MLYRGSSDSSPGSSWNYAARSWITLALPFAIAVFVIPWYGLVQNVMRAICLLVVYVCYRATRYCMDKQEEFLRTAPADDYPSELPI